jgi:hypothetical protein
MGVIDDQEIIQIGRTLNMMGSTLSMFLTFDGRWYRVRTRLETLGKYKRRDRAEVLFQTCEVAA